MEAFQRMSLKKYKIKELGKSYYNLLDSEQNIKKVEAETAHNSIEKADIKNLSKISKVIWHGKTILESSEIDLTEDKEEKVLEEVEENIPACEEGNQEESDSHEKEEQDKKQKGVKKDDSTLKGVKENEGSVDRKEGGDK